MCAQPAVREMLSIVFSVDFTYNTVFWGLETLFTPPPTHLLICSVTCGGMKYLDIYSKMAVPMKQTQPNGRLKWVLRQ